MCLQNLICRLDMIMIVQWYKIKNQFDQRETIVKKMNLRLVKIKKHIYFR